MNFRSLFFLFCACILLSCREIKEKLLPAFTVNIPVIKLNIPPIPFTHNKEVPVGALKASINMDSTINANTNGVFGASAVSFIKVKKITFVVKNANQKNNLSNFESGRMRIYSDNDTTALDIASVTFPTAYSDSLIYTPVNSADISKYLRGSHLYYNIYWKNRKPTTKPLMLSILVSISVQ